MFRSIQGHHDTILGAEVELLVEAKSGGDPFSSQSDNAAYDAY